MTTLTVTTRGQVTFRKDVLKHLGIQPGGKIRLEGRTNGARLSIDEINDAIADAGPAAGMSGIAPK